MGQSPRARESEEGSGTKWHARLQVAMRDVDDAWHHIPRPVRSVVWTVACVINGSIVDLARHLGLLPTSLHEIQQLWWH